MIRFSKYEQRGAEGDNVKTLTLPTQMNKCDYDSDPFGERQEEFCN